MIPQGCNPECRGCSHREWPLEKSLEQKYEFLRKKLLVWANTVDPVRSVSDEKRWGYRTKTTLTANYSETGWELGMWRRDTLVPIPNCPVHDKGLNEVLKILAKTIPANPTFGLKYVVVSGAQVVLVIKSRKDPGDDWLTPSVIAELEGLGVEGLWYHMNPSTGRRIFEKTGWRLVWGKPRSVDYNGLLYGPAAFQQLIPELYNQSLDEAEWFLQPDSNSTVIDLYCGTGNSMRRWVNYGATVLGVELGGEAVECAHLNVPEALVLRGACRQRVPQLTDWANNSRNSGRKVLLYVNPPRTGLEQDVLEWIVNEGLPLRMAYLSCSPGTLSKNIDFLCRNGYSLQRCIPFDFFPQTHHVETLALLQRASVGMP